MTNQSNTEQMREALRKIKHEAVSLADAQVIALEALTAPAAEVPEAMGDAEAKKVLLASDLYDMHKHVGWYSAPEKNFKEKGVALILSVAAARDAQWQSTRPAPGVPEGWRDAKNDPPPVGVDVLVAAEFDGPGDWRIKVGGRNPEQRTGWWVFGASWAPQVWMPLDAHRAALAAAQAKGGE